MADCSHLPWWRRIPCEAANAAAAAANGVIHPHRRDPLDSSTLVQDLNQSETGVNPAQVIQDIKVEEQRFQ
jgi:hypothetical protein